MCKSDQAGFVDLCEEVRSATFSAGDVRQRMRDQGVLSGGGAEKKPAPEIPEDVPRALHRFYKKGTE